MINASAYQAVFFHPRDLNMYSFNLRKTLLASLLSAALAPSAFGQTFSNTNDTAYFWGVDTSGTPKQITGVSAVPFQGDPYTIMYADDNQGVPLNTNRPGTDTANVIVYDGGLGTNNTDRTYVKINGGRNNISVAGSGIVINGSTNVTGGLSVDGRAVATNESVAAAVGAIDLTPYAQLNGANFTGAVSATALIAGPGGISAGGAGITNAGDISGANSVTASGAVSAGSLSSAGALNAAGLSTLSGGISAGGAGIIDAGAITGATSVTASGAVSGGSLSSASTLNVTGLSTLSGGISAGGAGITNAGAISGATSVTASGAVSAGSLASASTLNVTGLSTLSGGISAAGAGITNAGAISGATSVTASGAVSAGSLASASTLNVTGLSTLSGGISAGGAGITNAGAISGATSVTASGAVSAGSLASAGTLDVNGLATMNAGAVITGKTGINTTGTAATLIGNANTASSTVVSGGNAAMGISNNAATLSVANGGSVTANATSATLRGTGSLASNGTTGIASAGGAGAVTVYNTSQTIAGNTTINNSLDGRTYQNKLSGNTFVDGNVYINGTLAYVSSNSATTTVVGTNAGTSKLAGATQGTAGGTAIVMKGSDNATESVASLTLTNGMGNRHGVEVYEDRAVFSGGAHSTTMTLDDNGASFANVQGGGPVRVTGVADGTSDFDAVNYRQLRNVNRGVASISAMANIPQVDPGKTFSMGAGVGSYNGETSIALGGSYRISTNTVVKASFGTSKGNKATTVFGAGAAMSW